MQNKRFQPTDKVQVIVRYTYTPTNEILTKYFISLKDAAKFKLSLLYNHRNYCNISESFDTANLEVNNLDFTYREHKNRPIETFDRNTIINDEESIFYYSMDIMQPNRRPISILTDWQEFERKAKLDKNVAGVQRNFTIQ